MSAKKICAIYTRKSTEEGLDMDFNSLDAQREACGSYILSQKSEGWQASPCLYDDGGFSGGNIERPALKRLLEDIKAGIINIVVVYKIDRLTRSLMDFSKLVEIFDQYGVTFVSVTQSFNTTTSMGRLTLNVLLSFAQFEREVTGERIRDKIAASKKKGMWMGSMPPVGFSLEGRQLAVIPEEAKLVTHIFERYLALKSVRALKMELERDNIVSPVRTSKTGREWRGGSFSRGNLYKILNNPAYIGKIQHKDKVYEGLHDGIINLKTWERVQDLLKQNGVERQKITRRQHMLAGLLFDLNGDFYSPTYTGKGNRRYRYYISQNLLQHKNHPKGVAARLPGDEIEHFVATTLRTHLASILDKTNPDHSYILKNQDSIPDLEFVRGWIDQIAIGPDKVTLHFKKEGVEKLASEHLDIKISEPLIIPEFITVPFVTKRGLCGSIIITPELEKRSIFDLPSAELKRLIQGLVWRDEHYSGTMLKDIAKREGYSEAYVSKAIFMSFKTLQCAA